ncbi:MAG: quercetin dioxygenase-like cupin family protein [Gammaproteobacteria bacterium]|jgi:quercetin dioxygenase-like cupin family protein
MSANDTARCVNVTEAAHFSSAARVNQELIATKGLVSRMNCYEPGQVTPMHKHPDEDEVLYIIEGRGAITFQDRADLPVKAGDLVCLPADQFHQIVAAADNRMVLIYFMKPDYVSVRPDERGDNAAVGRLNGERS